jgi:hypothetical protein
MTSYNDFQQTVKTNELMISLVLLYSIFMTVVEKSKQTKKLRLKSNHL